MKLDSISAMEVLDSRGNPTVEVEMKVGKQLVRGVAPSGASTGSFEAVELRDVGKRYLGKGVQTAVENVNNRIAPEIMKLIGKPKRAKKKAEPNASPAEKAVLPKDLDELMITLDGTKNKGGLGANAMTATSMALVRAFAASEDKPLHQYVAEIYGNEKPKIPQPMFNILNGGKHAGNGLAVQEMMIMPRGKSFAETLQMASEIYHTLGKILVEKYGPVAKNVGDEGGYAPPISKTEDALDAIMKAIEEAGYQKETTLAMDCAASSFYESITKTYHIDERGLAGDFLRKYYLDLVKRYPISSIEDPFNEEDFGLFHELTEELGKKIMVVGDDLLVTNPERIQTAIEMKACNALLLKVNQIGTVSEAIAAAKMADYADWQVVVSHRSGETEDTFIADFATGIGAGFIKTGAPARGERTAKYNQLLRLEKNGVEF